MEERIEDQIEEEIGWRKRTEKDLEEDRTTPSFQEKDEAPNSSCEMLVGGFPPR